jgi:hypothetical protein
LRKQRIDIDIFESISYKKIIKLGRGRVDFLAAFTGNSPDGFREFLPFFFRNKND